MAKAKPDEPAAGPRYELVGLERADSMPISFAGQLFDLANLSADEAEFLLQYPEQVPYLKILNVSDAPV